MSKNKITVGYGTPQEREVEITDFIQAQYKDNRLITVAQVEDNSLIAIVENPVSTGRNPQSTIWLSKESFLGLISTAFIYFSTKGEDLGELMKEIVQTDNIEFVYSDNLKNDE